MDNATAFRWQDAKALVEETNRLKRLYIVIPEHHWRWFLATYPASFLVHEDDPNHATWGMYDVYLGYNRMEEAAC